MSRYEGVIEGEKFYPLGLTFAPIDCCESFNNVYNSLSIVRGNRCVITRIQVEVSLRNEAGISVTTPGNWIAKVFICRARYSGGSINNKFFYCDGNGLTEDDSDSSINSFENPWRSDIEYIASRDLRNNYSAGYIVTPYYEPAVQHMVDLADRRMMQFPASGLVDLTFKTLGADGSGPVATFTTPEHMPPSDYMGWGLRAKNLGTNAQMQDIINVPIINGQTAVAPHQSIADGVSFWKFDKECEYFCLIENEEQSIYDKGIYIGVRQWSDRTVFEAGLSVLVRWRVRFKDVF